MKRYNGWEMAECEDGPFIKLDEFMYDECKNTVKKIDKLENRIHELENALSNLIEAVKDSNGHKHDWELDESLEDALHAAGDIFMKDSYV